MSIRFKHALQHGERAQAGEHKGLHRAPRPNRAIAIGGVLAIAAALAGLAIPAAATAPAGGPIVSVSTVNAGYVASLDEGSGDAPAVSPLDLSYLADSLAARNTARGAGLPASFDLRESNHIGAVLNQQTTENCWAFAALSSAEASVAAYRPHTELSRSHLAWYTFTGDEQSEADQLAASGMSPYQHGAFEQQPVATLASWQGPISAADGPFLADSYTEPLRHLAAYHLSDAFYLPSSMNGYYDRPLAPSVDAVKTILHDHGPVTVSIATHGEFTHNTRSTYYTDVQGDIDHTVLIVGWDDAYPLENFDDGSGVIPERDGAWLIKNSWGTTASDYDGYLWLSYEDASAVYGVCYQLESAENYDVNYQFDTLGWTTSLAVGDDDASPDAPGTGAGGDAYMANIFTVGADGLVALDEDADVAGNEELQAASFYTTDERAAYTISVYRDPKPGDPASGTLVGEQTGSEEYPGYHTIELEDDLRCILAPGETFSIVIGLSNPVYSNPIAAEGIIGLGSAYVPEHVGRSATGELETSYVSADGEAWMELNRPFKDAKGVSVYVSNVCLKAFTSKVDGVTSTDLGEEWPEACVGGITPRITRTVNLGDETVEVSEPLDPLAFDYDEEAAVWRAVCAVNASAGAGEAPRLDLLVTGDRALTGEFVTADDGGGASDAGSVREAVELACNRWSELGDLDFSRSPIATVRIVSAGAGKRDAVYEIAVVAQRPAFDMLDETVSFDEDLYRVFDPAGNELRSGDAVGAWATLDTEGDAHLTVRSAGGLSFKLPIPHRRSDPTAASFRISYFDETIELQGFDNALLLRDGQEAETVWSGHAIAPGDAFRLKKGASATHFASRGTTELITVPRRPAAPAAPAVLETAPTSVTLERLTADGGMLEFSLDGADWTPLSRIEGLQPGTTATIYARVSAADEPGGAASFASDPVSFTVTTPELARAFDLRDAGVVPAVRNQGPYNLGWAYAAIASLETSALMQAAQTGAPIETDSIDLSEAALALLTYRRTETSPGDPSARDAYVAEDEDAPGTSPTAALAAGGTWQMAASTLARGQGAASERNVPLIVSEDVAEAGAQMDGSARQHANEGAVALASARVLDDPITLADGFPVFDERAANAMKVAIEQEGALFANAARATADGAGWGEGADGAARSTRSLEDPQTGSDHAVAIVGWDDDFSAMNFAVPYDPEGPEPAPGAFGIMDTDAGTVVVPLADGAWLVRDSGGTELGDDGYYYVSYLDLSLRNPVSFAAQLPDEPNAIHEASDGRQGGTGEPDVTPGIVADDAASKAAGAQAFGASYQYDGLAAVDLKKAAGSGGAGSGPDAGSGRSASDATPADAGSSGASDASAADAGSSGNTVDAAAIDPGSLPLLGANVFRARIDDVVERIGTWASTGSCRITAYVFTDLADPDDPTSGTLAATVAKTVKAPGYYLLDLPQAVSISAGERFSVAVALQDVEYEPGATSVPLEGGGTALSGYAGGRALAASAHPAISQGQSFICEDGAWRDVALARNELSERVGTPIGNVAAKAFGSNSSIDPQPGPDPHPDPDPQPGPESGDAAGTDPNGGTGGNPTGGAPMPQTGDLAALVLPALCCAGAALAAERRLRRRH